MGMQCSWLSFCSSLLHTLIKEDEDFFEKEETNHIKDPKIYGVQITNAYKKKIKNGKKKNKQPIGWQFSSTHTCLI